MIGKRIGIIGLGRLGTLLAEILAADHTVIGVDDDPAKHAAFAGAAPLSEVAACDTVFLCVPISRLEDAVLQARDFFADGAVVLDVCSVKIRPVEIMERLLPARVSMLPTHPMFGPDAVEKEGLRNMPFVVCRTERTRSDYYDRFCEYLTKRELRVVRMSADEHDRTMAYSLCLTHLIGRAVDRLELKESASDTDSFRQLLEIRRIACNDTDELFRDMQTWNPHAQEMRRRLAAALNEIELELRQLDA